MYSLIITWYAFPVNHFMLFLRKFFAKIENTMVSFVAFITIVGRDYTLQRPHATLDNNLFISSRFGLRPPR